MNEIVFLLCQKQPTAGGLMWATRSAPPSHFMLATGLHCKRWNWTDQRWLCRLSWLFTTTCNFLQFNLCLTVIYLCIIWRHAKGVEDSIPFHSIALRSLWTHERIPLILFYSRDKGISDHYRSRLESRAKRASFCWFRSCGENQNRCWVLVWRLS